MDNLKIKATSEEVKSEEVNMYNDDLQTIIEALKTQLAYNYKNGLYTKATSKTLQKMEFVRSAMMDKNKEILDQIFRLTINVVGF